jgi:hypothetical protein
MSAGWVLTIFMIGSTLCIGRIHAVGSGRFHNGYRPCSHLLGDE